jgi:uncharacterized protein
MVKQRTGESMTQDRYSYGTPCRVETWQADIQAAAAFYRSLFGWEIDDDPAPGDDAGRDARLGGQLVAGIRRGLPGFPTVWMVYIGVENVDRAAESVERAGGRLLIEATGPAERRLAVVADPAGVAFGIWAGNDGTAQLAGAPNSWAMSALHTPDLDAARRFYGEVFGWELQPLPGAPMSQWLLDGRRVAVAAPADGSVPAHWAVNFAVADADAFAQHATSLGASVLMPPTDTPGFRSAVLVDPQGAVIAVSAVRS